MCPNHRNVFNGVNGTNQYKSVVRYGKRPINTKPKGKDRA